MAIAEDANSTDKWWAIVVGSGVALSPIHNQWVPELTTAILGISFVAMMFGSAMFLLNHWEQVRQVGWGEKKLVIPMVALVVVMALSGFINGTGFDFIAPLGMGLAMFALYLTSRVLSGNRWLVMPTLIVGAIAILVTLIVGIVAPSHQDYGLITNYCALAGFMVLSGLLVDRKWLWVISGVIVIAVAMTGALEGLFLLGVLGIAVLVRRDWGKRALLPVGIVAVAGTLWWATGGLAISYEHATKNFRGLLSMFGVETEGEIGTEGALDYALTGRWVVIRDAMSEIRPFGYGYVLTPNPKDMGDRRPVHNMPLLAVDQVGPIGGALWLYITVLCLVRTRWKYVWITVLAAGVFDYYMWTQLMPYWWMFIGLSTMDKAKNDYIFKGAI